MQYLSATEPFLTETTTLEVPTKTLSLIEVTLDGMVTDVKPVHIRNVAVLIVLTLLGILTDFNFEQPTNAPSPRVVRPLGRVIEVSAEQPEKACSLILVTELGMLTDFNLLLSINAPAPIVLILEDTLYDVAVDGT